MRKLIQGLILLGTVSLIYFEKVTEDGQITLDSIRYRSDFVFFIVAILAIGWGVINLYRVRFARPDKSVILITISLTAFLFFCFIATARSYYFIYDLNFDRAGFINLSKMLVGVILSYVVCLFLKNDNRFYRYLAVALYVPPLVSPILGVLFWVYPPAFYAIFGDNNYIVQQYSVLLLGERFSGLSSNPFQIVFGNLTAISFLWVMLLYYLLRKSWIPVVVVLTYMVGLICIIYWTGVRSAIIGLLFMLIYGSVVMCNVFKKNPTYILTLTCGLFLLGSLSFFFLPTDIQAVLASRMEEGGDSRLPIWNYFLGIALDNPLGIGFNYEQKFLYPAQEIWRDDYAPHNVFLVAWMWGGIGALLSLLIFSWFCVKHVTIQFRHIRAEMLSIEQVYYIGAAIAFVTLWFTSVFIGVIFSDFIQAILFGMILAGKPTGGVHYIFPRSKAIIESDSFDLNRQEMFRDFRNPLK